MTEEKEQKKSIKEFKNIYNLVKKDKWKLLIAFICIFISFKQLRKGPTKKSPHVAILLH